MAFYGCDFTFNGISASSKGLMLYSFGTNTQDDVDLSVGEIVEDRITRRTDSLLYGLVQNEPLEFTLVFGADPDDVDAGMFLTRARINEVAQWLTGHQTWKTLTINQEDMMNYHYKCMITGLRVLTDGTYPWAFSCRVTCDSPFAYMDVLTITQILSGTTKTFTIDNTSVLNGYYYPMITITDNTNGNLMIANVTDNNRTCALTGMPSGSQDITIDCKNCVITSSVGHNLYPYFNRNFFRLLPGVNSLSVFGTGTLSIICEFPVNIGA